MLGIPWTLPTWLGPSSSVSLSSGKLLWNGRRRRLGRPPKITKNQAVHKWMDAFTLHLTQKVGVRNAPVAYVVWVIAAVDPTPPAR